MSERLRLHLADEPPSYIETKPYGWFYRVFCAIRIQLAMKLFPKHCIKIEGNWAELSYETVRGFTYTLTCAPTSGRTFSRETLYSMLKTVRENERRMNWRVPEPTADTSQRIH